jgi:hypothetical protein
MLHQQPVLFVSVLLGVAGPVAVYNFADAERKPRVIRSL